MEVATHHLQVDELQVEAIDDEEQEGAVDRAGIQRLTAKNEIDATAGGTDDGAEKRLRARSTRVRSADHARDRASKSR